MNKKKLLTLLLAAAALISLAAISVTKENGSGKEISSASNRDETIVLLHTNDVHGAIGHYAEVAALKSRYESEGAYVLLLDAGDFIQGDPAVNTSQGATAVELMNLCKYDAAALGNHEFDYGYDNIRKLEKDAEFPFLGANILYNGEKAFTDHLTFITPAGMKIGIFGIDTPETATKSHPAHIKGVTFLGQRNAEEMFECAQAQVDALKAEGCGVIVCLAHLGIDGESAGRSSIDMLHHVTGIDVLIDGHSHSTLEEVKAAAGGGIVNGACITSAGSHLESVGKVVITNGKTACASAITTEGIDIEPDPAVDTRAKEILKQIDDEYGEVFARTEVELNGAKASVRSGETNMGDLITDAMLWSVCKNGIKCDAVIMNGGNIRASIPMGGITKKDIKTVLPFRNELCVVRLTGAELLEALEASTFCAPDTIGGFPNVAGIEFTLDTSKPYDAGDKYPGSTYAKPNSIGRVSVQTVNGKPFDAEAVYSVATNDFLASGGDTYYVFKAAASNINLGLLLDEVVTDYIVTELHGVVSAEKYGSAESRITIVYRSDTDSMAA